MRQISQQNPKMTMMMIIIIIIIFFVWVILRIMVRRIVWRILRKSRRGLFFERSCVAASAKDNSGHRAMYPGGLFER